jgi:hypothetical protein
MTENDFGEYDSCEASDNFGTSGFGGPTEESDNFGCNSVLQVEHSPSLPVDKPCEPTPPSKTLQPKLGIFPFSQKILEYLISQSRLSG